MRNIFNFLMPVAVAATVFASCAKETKTTAEPEGMKITVKARPEQFANIATSSKTYIDGTNTILWGAGEHMILAVTAGSNTAFGTSAALDDQFIGQDEGIFEFSITPESASSYTYQGLYPASAVISNSNTNVAEYKVELPAIQSATPSSYDPAAYILVAKPETFDAVQTDWLTYFRRATALNKITLTNLAEDIKRVTITAPGTSLAGRRYFNLTTGESGEIYYGGTETIEVNYSTKLSGGSDMNVWFTSWEASIPVGSTLTVVATSATHTFTRTITVANKPITFKEGYLNTLTINMSSAVQEDSHELEAGDYVVLAKNGDSYYALTAALSGNHIASTDYTGSTSSYSGNSELIWSVTKSGDSYILANGGKYIGYKGSSNEAYWLEADETWTTTNYLLDIVWAGSSYHITLNSNGNRKFSRNSSSNYFAFYTSDQQKEFIFVPATVDNRTAVTLSFADAAVNYTTANYNEFTGQAVTVDPNVAAITGNLTWSFTPAGIIEEFNDDGTLTLNGDAGNVTVTVSFAGDATYLPAEASYTIAVTDASELSLTFPFSSAIDGWPASSGASTAGSYTYTLAETDYSFTHTKVGNGIYCAGSYLMIVSGNYLGLPAISGYKLVSVSAQLNGGGNPSLASQGSITSDTNGTVVTGGEAQTFDTKGDSKTFTLTGTSANTVYYLAISNKNFQCTEIALVYSRDSHLDPGMSWSAASASATIDDGDVVTFTAPTLTPGHATNISYESTDTDVATISNTGVVTVLGGGQTTIKAIFAGDATYGAATATYTLNVTDNRTTYDFTTIAGLNALVTSTSATFRGYLTNAVVSFVPATNTAIVKDATGSVMIYNKSGHGLLQGQTYTGVINVTALIYRSNNSEYDLYSEITAMDASFTGSQAIVAPQSLSLADVIGHYDEYQNAYVQIAGLTVVSKSDKNINVTDGTNNYVVYDNPGNVTCAAGDVITATGTITKYQTTEELKVWAASDITITASSPKAVTFTQPSQTGCSISVSVSGSPISSGATVASGTTVTIAATAGDGYEFSSWVVDGATVADASAASTSFVMGASAVSVSAVFSSTGGGEQTPTLQYTLDGTITATGNAYATATLLTQNGIGWAVVGNTEMSPWRLGGKSITQQNREIYSTTAISANISQINVVTGATGSSLTVNSLTISVHGSAADAESGSNAIATKTVTSGIVSSTVTFNKTDNTSWAGKYYRIVYNVTRSGSSGNGYVQFSSATFYGTN